ncbi:MAG: DUF3857 domain-containing protein [Acidobacteria bacterium]|nr:DUF3857 domain-containing protein [Acidobacteriota bacterium]
MKARTRHLAASLLVALAALAPAGLRAEDKLPEWAVPLAAESVSGYDPVKHDAVCLMDYSEAVFDDQGVMTRTVREAFRILSAEGERHGVRALSAGPNLKIREFRGWVQEPNGKVAQVKMKDTTETQLLESSLFTEYKKRVASLPNVGKGAFVCFEYETEQRDYPPFLRWSFQGDIPTRHSELVVRVPPGAELTWKAYNIKDFQPISAAGTWVFRRKDVAALPTDEPCLPPRRDVAEQVAVRLHLRPGFAAKTWAEAADWYRGLTSARWPVPASVNALADEICEGAADDPEKVRRLCAWVQSQVRYVSVHIGLSGMIPTPSEEVCTSKFGDCKGKSFLLMHLLRSRGIPAWPVLCSSRGDGRPDPDFASLSDFNHCIVALKPADGATRFFDPTCETAGWPALPPGMRQAKGLLVREQGGELVTIDAPDLELSAEVKVDVTLAVSGFITAKVVETYRNGIMGGLRQDYREITELERRKKWQGWLSQRIPDVRLTALEWKNLFDPEKDLVIAYTVESNGVLRPTGSLWLFQPFFVIDVGKPVLTKPERQVPVDLGGSALVSVQEVTIRYPEGWKVEENLEALRKETDFGCFSVAVEEAPNRLVVRKRYQVKGTTLPVERYPDARDFFKAVQRAEQQEILFMAK